MPGKSYSVPGASLGDGYVIPGAPDNDAVLAAALADTRAVLDEQAEAEQALPPDPGVVNARNAIKNEYDVASAEWNERRRRHLADPHRTRYTPSGQQELDQELETKLSADRAALTEKLARRLDVVEDAVRTRLDATNVVTVGVTDDDTALRFAATLSHVSPQHGGSVLA